MDGAINITGDANISAVNGNGLTYAARVFSNGKIKMGDYGTDDGATRVVKGHILSQNSGDITLRLTKSYCVQPDRSGRRGGRYDPSDRDKRGNVECGGQQRVTNFYTGNNAIIDMTYLPGNFQTLKIDNLEGSGGSLFKLKTDIEGDASDTIKVTNGTGTNRILVHSVGAEPQRERMNTYLAEVASGDASFVLENRARLVDAGTYVYDLHNETNANTGVGTGWYLQRTEREILSPTAEAVVTLTGLLLPIRCGTASWPICASVWVKSVTTRKRTVSGSGHLARRTSSTVWKIPVSLRTFMALQPVSTVWSSRMPIMTGFSVSRANIRKPIRIFTDYGAARARTNPSDWQPMRHGNIPMAGMLTVCSPSWDRSHPENQ